MQNTEIDQQAVAASLVRDLVREKRSCKRWRNVRFFLGFALILFIVIVAIGQHGPSVSPGEGKDYIALIRLNGMIGPGEDFSAETVQPLLFEAFTDKDAKGVILDINSGGGTPVQAAIIHDLINRYKKQYHKKVIVVGEDMLASGAYFVAVAADKIYVNPNTITGSIGVIMKGFGFPDLLKKLGIERRVYTSGADKDRLDPFLPQSKQDVEKIQQVISEVHDNFDQVVLKGREGKLKEAPEMLFTGDFWSGTSALKLGLVDGLGNLQDVMEDEFQVSRYKDYSEQQPILKSLLSPLGSSLNLGLADTPIRALTKM